ncbi:MAG: hypothetical protein LQ337_006637 [Flavoplaca oasis]|nr:MAG: hypothetical protein LQ337_006637 [Flavoplaca oasis]
MSLGYSVGDFVLLGQLAWKVYKSCKGAPESFVNISYEVLSLHAVVKEFGDNLREENPAPAQLAGLRHLFSTSQITVQKQLQQFLNRQQRSGKEGSVISSQSLSSGDSKTWRDIRKELEGFGISVAAFNANKAFIFEWQQKASRSGKLDNSHDCSISTPSVSSENSKLWREIRKDLEGVGVTPATF